MADANNSEEILIPPMNNAILGMQDHIAQNAVIRAGRKSIIDNRNTYLTKLEGQSPYQFKAMVSMAPMYIIYPKVVDGFTGTVFAKPPVFKNIEFDEKQKNNNKNCDLLGNSLEKFSEKVITAVFENGFCATMNDYSDKAKRSFLRFISPEQIISFKTNSDAGYPIIDQFIYKEDVEINNSNNEFDVGIKTKYIVLDIHEGIYRVRKYISSNNKDINSKSFTMIKSDEDSFPKKDGVNFDYIPIIIHGINKNNFSVTKSPLQDISDMNISVIQRVIDQVYMLHWTALPTPWATGVDDDSVPETIGPSRGWFISNPDAKVGMLEFSGSSARAHQDFIDNLKDIMASMGAQVLKKEGVSRETATSVLVRTAAQTSLIATLVNNVSSQMQKAIELFFAWGGNEPPKEFVYQLNNDFLKIDMEPNAQIALVKSWMSGAISHRSLFNKMKEGEIVDPNITFEEEIENIKENPPPFFEKQAELNNQIEVFEKTGNKEISNNTKEDKENKEDMEGEIKGSNLDNGNINNPQTD